MNNYRLYFLIIVSTLSASINFNYESKYGNGSSVIQNQSWESFDTTSYYYYENLLDINFNYQNLFLYTELEYSNSPIYGGDKIYASNLANSYFAEFSNSDLMVKYGHIQTIYNYGLDINMFQDHNTNFDNRIKGWELRYTPIDIVDLYFISGRGKYGSKTDGALRRNNLFFNHDIQSYGTQIYSNFGDISFSSTSKTTHYNSIGVDLDLDGSDDWANYILWQAFNIDLFSPTRLASDLQNFNNNNFSLFDSLASLDINKVNLSSFNFSYSNTLGNFDIYIENNINTYNKILREDEKEGGYLRYLSLAGDIFDLNLLYEFKDYNMLYYMPITSSPPVVYGETTSVLMSRTQHTVDFSDEIGHQIEARFNINNNNILLNLSLGMKHSGIDNPNEFNFEDGIISFMKYDSRNFSDLINMDFSDSVLVAHKPFRDFYIESSGWNNKNTFYYKVGYGSQYNYDNGAGKNYQSQTIPTQFVLALNNKNSITLYYETQILKNMDYDSEDIYVKNEIDNNYLSLSYYMKDIGTIAYFNDSEQDRNFFPPSNDMNSRDRKIYWEGYEFTFDISSSMKLSIFKGSQRGGLVCANGVCAVQPAFQDGVKVTFRALF
jgi:hypothetical protein